ncbi:MAG: hypothetical protein DMF68_18980 [Acidobacteria bacterium]|nr:MAG: hypothetical protein DMF68_18980 [Acidobacteriota bacterium]
MQVRNHTNLSAEQLGAIKRDLPDVCGLQDVVKWGLRKDSGVMLPGVIAEVIVQDEFTHDVIVPWRDGLVLVCDTT